MSTRTRTTFITALLILTALASVPGAHGVHGGSDTTKVIHIQDLDENDITEATGTGTAVLINVTDGSKQGPTITVDVTSDSDDTGETITLFLEPEADGGSDPGHLYRGLLGFETSFTAGNGEVYVADGDTVRVTYAGATEKTLTWNASNDGDLAFNQATYRGDNRASTLTYTDAALNESGVTTVLARVVSDSDPGGIVVVLEDQGSGEFVNTTINLIDGGPSVNASNDLEVDDGDTITATLDSDDVNARGHEESPSDTATWERTHSAHVAFLEAGYQTLVNETGAALDGTFFGTGTATSAANANAFIRVEDPDRAGDGTLSVVVSSPAGTRTITLAEQGSDGEFLGFFGFIEAPGSSTGNRLSVADGHTVTAKYDDVRNATGQDEDVLVTATWNATHTGIVRFMTSDTYLTDTGSYEYNTTTSEAGENNRTAFIRLNDEDLLAGKPDDAGGAVTVRVTSTKDPIGVNVTLTDGGPSDSFVGTVRVNSTHSGQGVGGDTPFIWAVADDDIFVTYDDAHTADGVRDDASDKADIAKGSSGTKHATNPFATGETTPSLKLQSVAGGSAADDLYGKKTFHVELNHYASNNDSTEVELIAEGHVVIGSSSAFLNWTDAGWTGDWTSPTWYDTTAAFAVDDLEETGADTGIFRGTFTIPDDLAVADGDTVTAAFLANHTHSGSPTPPVKVLVDTAVWHATVGADVEFTTEAVNGTAASTYRGLSMGHVRVNDADLLEDDSTGRDTIKVQVISETDTAGFELTLTERYARSTGEAAVEYDNDQDGFLGSFTFCSTDGCTSASNKRLEVSDDDTITVEYTDPGDELGAPSIVLDTATWVETHSATIGLDKEFYRAGSGGTSTVTVTVTDADKDTTGAPDSFDVLAVNEAGGSHMVGLTETGADTGIFRGTFTIGDAAVDLVVDDGKEFTVSYTDAFDADGDEGINRTASAPFFDTTGGRLFLDNDLYATTAASATVSLEDPDFNANAEKAETLKVWVYSDTDGAGDRVELNETGPNTGLFEGTLRFETARVLDNGKVKVTDGDRFTVYYYDDSQMAAKVAHAFWQSSEIVNRAPSAALSATPTDVQTDTDVEFSITVSDPDGDDLTWELDFGDGSAVETGTSSTTVNHAFTAEGDKAVVLTVSDGALETERTVTINVDGTAPGDITDLSEVTAEKKSNSLTLEWVAPGDDGSTGNATAYQVKVSTSSITTETDFDAADDATFRFCAGSGTCEATSPSAASGATERVRITQIGGVALSPDTTYVIAIRAVDEVGNTGAIATTSATTATPDTTAPTGTLTVSSSTHTSGQASTNNDPTFSWSGISDDESTITYYYVLNSQSTFSVTSSVTGTYSGNTADTNVSFTNVPAGVWYFHVAGISDGGSKQAAPFTLTITGDTDSDDDDDGPDLSAAQIEAANKLITVTVAREGDENHVSWELPATPPATVQGVQIWRSNSPYTLLHTAPIDSTIFDDAEYIDSSSGALEDSVYLVTMYYAGGVGLFDASNAPDTNDYDGTSVGEDSDAFPSWLLWLLIGLGVVILLVVILVVVVVSRKEEDEDELEDEEDYGWSDEEGWEDEEEAAFAPEEGETHHLMCPNCQTRFTATGTKPLVTNCPGCGKKGILR